MVHLSIHPLRRLWVPALVALLLMVALGGLLPKIAGRASAQPPSAAVTGAGQTAFEFVGRIDQQGTSFVSFGYVTYVNGIDPGVLFTDPLLHNETTARITYYATGSLTARSVISGVTELHSLATTSFYYNATPAANFGNPNSFKNGTPIAAFDGRYQNILNVQAPNLGLAVNHADLTQSSAGTFAYGGQTYTFGRAGLALRSYFTGEGTRTDPVLPSSFTVGAGWAEPSGFSVWQPAVTH